jgi:hypothetical protein
MDIGKLRYHALWSYTGLIAGMIFLDKLPLTSETAIGVLAPIALVIGADIYKHRGSNE